MQISGIGTENALMGVEVAGRLAHPDNISTVTAKEEAFFRRMRGMPFVHQIDLNHLKRLKDAFKDATAEDPYSLSPTYYGLTGRRGLWVHQCESGDTAMIFCLHPNKDDTVLIFPPFGANPQPMLTGFLESIAPLGMNMQIGRVYKENTSMLAFARAARGLTAVEIPEDTLDWIYPVHTVATADLKAREGGHYARIRGACNKFSKLGAQIERINFNEDQRLLERLARDWEANNRTNYYDKYDIPTDYFLTLIHIAQRPDIGLHGLKVSLDGVIQGFSVWEPPYSQTKAANLLASQVANFSHTNLGTFLIAKTAEDIANQGGRYMCLGGSETEGMDTFKRGFRPPKSKALKTIAVFPTDSRDLIIGPTN